MAARHVHDLAAIAEDDDDVTAIPQDDDDVYMVADVHETVRIFV